jgi:hypothetical protein
LPTQQPSQLSGPHVVVTAHWLPPPTNVQRSPGVHESHDAPLLPQAPLELPSKQLLPRQQPLQF